MLGGVRETRAVDRKVKPRRVGVGESAIVPASASLVHKRRFSRYDTTLDAFRGTKYRKQDNAFPAGAWSVEYGGRDGSGREGERERASSLHVCPCVGADGTPAGQKWPDSHGEALGFMILVP